MEVDNNDFDLRRFLWRCWEARRKILLLAAIIFATGFSLLFSALYQYSSEGFLRAPRKFAEYNGQKSAFWDREALHLYLEQNKKLEDNNGRYLLTSLSESFVQSHLQAVLPLSKDDLRYISDIKATQDTSGIIGFIISFKGQTAEDAQARVQLMGDFIKDAMLEEDLLEMIHTKLGDAIAKKQQIDNQIIQKRVSLAQAGIRMEAARSIANKYPEASKMETRQLLSTGNDNQSSRYLSPMAQLVGIETEMADLKSQLTLLERDAAQNALRAEFYDRIEQHSREALTGHALLADFVKTGQAVFTGKDLQDDKVREVYNQIALVADQMRTKHISEPRFVSGPTLPDSRSGPSMTVVLLLLLVAAVAFASIAVVGFDALRKPVEQLTQEPILEKEIGLVEDSLKVRAS
ncbi:hypothetical protein UB44_21095 [Burkholderiaceae bacterium 26]|nr:hypothetical protein UB44_21095 [Burkholderiaceae bacterium 26]